MTKKSQPLAIIAGDATPRIQASIYPEPFASMMEGRIKRTLGDLFGLANFGINLTRLHPGAISALRHSHSRQDEFIFVLQGCPTLHTDEGEMELSPGMCSGNKAGSGNSHRLVNRTNEDVVYLEIGDRTADDTVYYPDDDIQAVLVDGQWQFTHKDGTPFE